LEEERRIFVDFVEFLRHSHAQMDHWFQEEGSFAHSFTPEAEDTSLAPWREVEDWQGWQSVPRSGVEKAFFVDGRMRVHARILVEEKVLFLGELLAGYAIWEKSRGVSMGFSPQRWPLLRRVLGVPAELLQGKNLREQHLDLGEGFIFWLEESARGSRDAQGGEAAHQALFNVLSRLEREMTLELLREGFPVIKDGILHPWDSSFAFRPGVGPVGLVKRIERLPLSEKEKSVLFALNRGARTPFLSFELNEEFLKVFSYLKLTDRDEHAPWKGLVRLEVICAQELFPKMGAEIGLFFDSLAGFLPALTADFPWRRLPENIFPMIALEDALGRFFASSSWIQYLYERRIRR